MLEVSVIIGCLSLGMAPDLLLAIVDQESTRNPIALNVNRWEGERYRPETEDNAIDAAERFVEAGYTVDVGLAGINSKNLERFGVPISDAFEPCTNVWLSERIYLENYRTAIEHGRRGDAAHRTALSLYNTGSLTYGFDNGYVDAVWERLQSSRRYLARTSGSRIDWDATPRGAGLPDRPGSGTSTLPLSRSSYVPWVRRARTDASTGQSVVAVEAAP